MSFVKNAALVALAAWSANAAPTDGELSKRVSSSVYQSSKPIYNGCTYVVPGIGSFTSSMNVDFSAITSLSAASVANISISNSLIGAGTAPFNRQFSPQNVALVSGGILALTVPGGQTTDPISSAEIQTFAKDILYGSVRTVAKTSSVGGTTHGFSFYGNDTQESDIAFLTSDNSVLHLTNEQTAYGNPATSFQVAAPVDAATAFHEYRMDWLPGQTLFYIDGALVYTITQNVPSTPGFFLWNNWSNGNAWAKGPPNSNNVLQIGSVSAYYNRTSVKVDENSSVCLAAGNTANTLSQSCDALNGAGSSYTDSKGKLYNISCNHDLSGYGDIAVVQGSTFTNCMIQCDAYTGSNAPCNGFAYTGGSGAGICYLKNVNGIKTLPNSNSNIDFAYLASANYPATSTTTSSSSRATSH